jgi:hypothetical protein
MRKRVFEVINGLEFPQIVSKQKSCNFLHIANLLSIKTEFC